MTYDPGAAGDLVGTDTLLDYDAGEPHQERTIRESNQTFSGIAGETTASLGIAKQPMQVGSFQIDYNADMIGGQGSFCPMLLGLPLLIAHQSIVLHGCYENGDGIIIFFPKKTKTRCLLFSTLLYRLWALPVAH